MSIVMTEFEKGVRESVYAYVRKDNKVIQNIFINNFFNSFFIGYDSSDQEVRLQYCRNR